MFVELLLSVFTWCYLLPFYHSAIPQPLRLWGIVITRGGRAVRNSALTKKLLDEFCLFFTDMTYVPGPFIPYIFLAPKHKQPFSKMAA